MAVHTEYSLGCPGVSEVLNLPLAVPTPEAGSAERLVASQYREVFNLISAGVAAVCTVVAYKRAIAEEKEVGIGVEQGIAGVAAEAVKMPPKASYNRVSRRELMTYSERSIGRVARQGRRRDIGCQRTTYRARRPCPLPRSGADDEAVSTRVSASGFTESAKGRTYLSTSFTREDILGIDRAV